MSLAIPTLSRRPRHHRRRTRVSPPPPPGGVRRIVLRFEWLEDRTVLLTFAVTSIADSGPGSLRQAILDSNAATGGTNTIDFAIPGTGIQTIAPLTPLPPITASLLIDATTQPGFTGTPLIALSGESSGSPAPLVISNGNLTVLSLAVDSVAIATSADERLVAVAHAQGVTTELSLLGPQGRVLVQSDGVSAGDRDNVIDQHLAEGTYLLKVASLSGSGNYSLSTSLTPASHPYQTISLPSNFQEGSYAPSPWATSTMTASPTW